MFSFKNDKAIRCIGLIAPILIMTAALLLAGPCGDAFAAGKSVRQTVFKSPEEAVKVFIEAIRNKDDKAVLAIFGPMGKDLIYSGDKVADQQRREQVIQKFDEKHEIVRLREQKAILELGKDKWPLPIPIVEEKGSWRFDTAAGLHEVLNRRIGKNELNAIQVCLSYVDAQREYADMVREKTGFPEYAQKLYSEPGKRDGLYWESKQGEKPSPVGIFLANAAREGYRKTVDGQASPYHGYRYRVLNAQGKDAPGGAFDYMVKNKMIGGFALIAYPARYGASGIMTFIINHNGVVYEKDLGPKTESLVLATKVFNPDKTWQTVKPK